MKGQMTGRWREVVSVICCLVMELLVLVGHHKEAGQVALHLVDHLGACPAQPL